MHDRTIRGVSFLIDGEPREPVEMEFALTPGFQAEFELKPLAPDPGKRNTKRVGDISEVHVIAAFCKRGYKISLPFGEDNRYDLVADDGEKLYRIQVKTGRVRGGVIRYSCSSSHAHRGGRTRPYFGEIDYLAVYCPDTGKVYLLPEKELTATRAHLRLSPPLNNMAKTIRWAARYELA